MADQPSSPTPTESENPKRNTPGRPKKRKTLPDDDLPGSSPLRFPGKAKSVSKDRATGKSTPLAKESQSSAANSVPFQLPPPSSQVNSLPSSVSSEPRPAANGSRMPIFVLKRSMTAVGQAPSVSHSNVFFGDLVCTGSKLTNGAAVKGLAKIVSQHKLSKECVEDFGKHIMSVLPEGSNNYPDRVEKYLQISPRVAVPKILHQCLGCLEVDSVIRPSCELCGTSLKIVSVQNNLRAIIKDLFENHQLADLIDKQKSQIPSQTDICNGFNFKTAKLDMSGMYDLCLVQNFDGFAIESGKVWRNFLAIVDIPIEHRQSFIIPANLWLTPENHTQPRIEDFMGPFVSLVRELHANGVEWTHPVTKLKHKSRICVILSVANEQDRALLQNLNLPTEMYGCSFCEIPGSQTQNSHLVCYPYREEKYVLRSTVNVTKNAVAFNSKSTDRTISQQSTSLQQPPLIHVKGVRGPTCLARLPNFDLGTSFTPDYVRSCLLGVVKSHLSLITDVKNQSEKFYLGANSKFIINARLEAIKMPPFTKTLPPSLATMENWKVAEYRNWLLYYSLPCLERMWSDSKYLEHFAHLVFAIHTMLSTEVSPKDRTDADAALRKFCSQYGELYGRDNESIDLHLHLHFAQSVINLGPLYAHSSLMFEQENETLKQHLKEAPTVRNGLNTSFQALHALRTARQVCDQDTEDTPLFFSAMSPALLPAILHRSQRLIKINCKLTELPKLFLRVRFRGIEYSADDMGKNIHSSYLMYRGSPSCGNGSRVIKVMAFARLDPKRCIVIGKRVKLTEPRYSFNTFRVEHIMNFEEVQECVPIHMVNVISPLVCVNLSETVGVASDCKVLCIPPNLIEDRMLQRI